MSQSIEQYCLYWVDLNPTKGAEINKTRPCVVISPSEMHEHLLTVMIAPLTSRGREGYPTRIKVTVEDVLDKTDPDIPPLPQPAPLAT